MVRQKNNKKGDIVILGCGRSGTSILGELFEHLPSFNYFFEPYIIQIVANYFQNRKKRIAVKVPKGGVFLTKGLSCNMNLLKKNLKKNTKIIWIVRNPLDTICSLRPGIEKDWSHNPKPPNYKGLLDEPWHIKCSHHWKYINNVGFKSAKKYGDPLVVKYEDLLNNTSKTVSEILEFIDSDYTTKDLQEYISLISNKTEGSYQAKLQKKWYKDNHKKRIGRYKENMSEKEVDEALEIVRNTSKNFYPKY